MIRATVGILAGTGRKPVALAATGVGENSFTANWEAYPNAVYYLLDVSKQEDFSTFVYENEVINAPATSYVVIGLEDDTTYYYRLRASTEQLFLLDEWQYPGAAAAYSLRKLKHDYKGSAIEVRNDSGVHLDIGFDENGDLDTTALLAHCGSGNGTVSTWYDQSGNGNDATQSTVSKQPQIVSSGSVILENGNPSVQFDGSDDNLVISSITSTLSNSIFVVENRNRQNTGTTDFSFSFALNRYYYDKSTFFRMAANSGNYLINSMINTTNQQEVLSLFYSSSGSIYKNSIVQDSALNFTPLNGTSVGTIGCYQTNTFFGQVKHQEIIYYTSDQSSNRTGIETNINQRYNIYFDGSYTPLLDTYSGSAAAYSLRLLNSSYTGPLIEVRNDSGVHADIGFTYDGKLNEEALLLHCGSGNGTVSTWYDQSGSGNDASQTTAANQPQIVSSGSVIKENGKPTVQFTNSSQHALFSPYDASTLVSFMTVIKVLGTNQRILNFSTANNAVGLRNKLVDELAIRGSSDLVITSNTTTQGQILVTGFNNTPINTFLNSSFVASGSIGSYTFQDYMTIGNTFALNRGLTGSIQEIILYPSDESSNRTGIETNINAEYQIYWDGSQTSLLDSYGGSAAAYSLRALSSAYTGPLVEVRNASGVHADIYAKYDGTLNTDALLAHCGTGDGTVSTWYDQSGNGYDATQSTAADQPTIVIGGIYSGYILQNNKVLTTSFPYTNSQNYTNFTVIKQTGGSVIGATVNTASVFYAVSDSSGASSFQNFSSVSYYKNGSLISGTSRNSIYNDILNQKVILTSFVTSNSTQNMTIGYPNYAGYQINETIIYSSNQSTNRAGINTNINEFYSIYYIATNSEYQDVLDYSDSQGYQRPSDAQCALQDALVGDLKDAGVWSKLDAFYVFATDGDSDFACINWKDPNNFECTEVNSPTFTPNEGFNGDGASSYLSTSFNMLNDSVNFQQDSASMGVYKYSGISGSSKCFMGVFQNSPRNRTHFNAFNTQGINTSSQTTGTSYNVGVASLVRNSSSNVDRYEDSLKTPTSFVDNSTSLVPIEMTIFTRNSGGSFGNFTDETLSMSYIGGDITSEYSDFVDAIDNYIASI